MSPFFIEKYANNKSMGWYKLPQLNTKDVLEIQDIYGKISG
jgi:hypothetical protein